MENSRILVAYFSRRGQNYVSGQIRELSMGNTEVIARMISEASGADMYEIEPRKSYPEDYTETAEISREEQRTGARPELKAPITGLDDYDIIFLGYPNWWGTAPMVLFTFLERYDFSGKRIIPFCTHEGSGMSGSAKDIAQSAKGAIVHEGIAIYGHVVHDMETKIKKWVSELYL